MKLYSPTALNAFFGSPALSPNTQFPASFTSNCTMEFDDVLATRTQQIQAENFLVTPMIYNHVIPHTMHGTTGALCIITATAALCHSTHATGSPVSTTVHLQSYGANTEEYRVLHRIRLRFKEVPEAERLATISDSSRKRQIVWLPRTLKS